MRVLFLGNGWVGWQVLRDLRARGVDVVGLVIHPRAHRALGHRLLEAAGVPTECVFDGSRLDEPEVLAAIERLHPDLGVCVFFRYLLRPALLDLLPRGCVNLHPSMLPFNRGGYPNVWSIVERTPAGVTLHLIDDGVDSGPVLAQREVPIEPVDTGRTLYRKLERVCIELFHDTWPDVAAGVAQPIVQDDANATIHRDRDVECIDRIDLDRTYTGRELIDVIRARTFPPHRGAFFVENGRSVHLRLELEYEPDPPSDPGRRDGR